MATETSIAVYRAEDVLLNFTVSPTTDITDWTIVFTVARRRNSTTKTITKTCSLITAAAGTFRATLLSADLDIDAGAYFWDCYRTDSGNKRCLGFGTFTVRSVAKYPTS